MREIDCISEGRSTGRFNQNGYRSNVAIDSDVVDLLLLLIYHLLGVIKMVQVGSRSESRMSK